MTPLLLSEVCLKCEKILGTLILNTQSISGRDINEAFLLATKHQSYFLKFNQNSFAADLLSKEVLGLQLLAQSGIIKTPEIIAQEQTSGCAFLLLNYITPSPNKSLSFWENFGTQLANFHLKNTSEQFGLDHDNYIGSLPQYNKPAKSWSAFYVTQRLAPQVKLAVESGKMDKQFSKSFDTFFVGIEKWCPREPAALIHGDLWSGNFIATSNDQPIFIDPSVSYSHREMDIAMSHLFGGFHSEFYTAYNRAYPLESGISERLDIYQLYYLLVHLNLFGNSYLGAVKRIVKRFV